MKNNKLFLIADKVLEYDGISILSVEKDYYIANSNDVYGPFKGAEKIGNTRCAIGLMQTGISNVMIVTPDAVSDILYTQEELVDYMSTVCTSYLINDREKCNYKVRIAKSSWKWFDSSYEIVEVKLDFEKYANIREKSTKKWVLKGKLNKLQVGEYGVTVETNNKQRLYGTDLKPLVACEYSKIQRLYDNVYKITEGKAVYLIESDGVSDEELCSMHGYIGYNDINDCYGLLFYSHDNNRCAVFYKPERRVVETLDTVENVITLDEITLLVTIEGIKYTIVDGDLKYAEYDLEYVGATMTNKDIFAYKTRRGYIVINKDGVRLTSKFYNSLEEMKAKDINLLVTGL